MPKVGEGKSIRINPDVYAGLLLLKHGNATFSDVIKGLLIEHEQPGAEPEPRQ
jgi:predicted CopG family antitoxin